MAGSTSLSSWIDNRQVWTNAPVHRRIPGQDIGRAGVRSWIVHFDERSIFSVREEEISCDLPDR